jgi:hypothetical protein
VQACNHKIHNRILMLNEDVGNSPEVQSRRPPKGHNGNSMQTARTFGLRPYLCPSHTNTNSVACSPQASYTD